MQIGNRKALSGDQRAGHFHGLVVGLMGGGVAKFAKHSITLQSDQPVDSAGSSERARPVLEAMRGSGAIS